MPNTILLPELRLSLARLYVETGRAISRNIGIDQMGANCDLTLIGAAVLVGHLEGRLPTASTLARYLEMPRTSVLRKLRTLIAMGVVEALPHGEYRLIGAKFGRKTKEVERLARLVDDTYKHCVQNGRCGQTG